MYIPSYGTLARALGISAKIIDLPAETPCTIDAGRLRVLLQFVALAADFDPETYLKENPDIAGAHEAKLIADLRTHFVQSGYFEERRGSQVKVDEKWYLETYPDVSNAIKDGMIESAAGHFAARGEQEMRSPNEEALPWMRVLAEALARPRQVQSRPAASAMSRDPLNSPRPSMPWNVVEKKSSV